MNQERSQERKMLSAEMKLEEILAKKLKMAELNDDIKLCLFEVVQRVREYLNYKESDELSYAVKFIIINMTIDLMALSKMKDEEPGLKSITMGDTSYSFDTASKAQLINISLDKYEAELRRYRRFRK